MSSSSHSRRPQPVHALTRVQLRLKTPDGAGWSLTVSRGMERFIGHYPRVPGLGSGGPLLRYSHLDRL
ncbi:MAG: hypothetical protein ACJ8ER_02385 [Allosphingosinicella sp.]